MKYIGVALGVAALALIIGQPVLDRPEVTLYLCLVGLLAIGAVAPVTRLLEALGWQDPAKRMLASWVAHAALLGLTACSAVLAGVVGVGGAHPGRLPWALMLLVLGGTALLVSALRVGDRKLGE